MIDLSVIIVNWNTKYLLLECLQSVLRATKSFQIEIIVVDNGSTDGSPDAVREKFPTVRLITNDWNIGFAKANNLGIKKSTGRYICLLNSDINVTEKCFDRIYDYMQKCPSVGILGPKILNPNLSLQRSCRKFPSVFNSLCRALALDRIFPNVNLFPADTIRSVHVLSGCFWMVRRDALNDVGLLDEQFFMYSEDKDWCRRFWQSGWKVIFYPDAEAIHYGGASSDTSPVRFLVEMEKANFQYWRKHHSKLAQFSFFCITILSNTVRLIGYAILNVIGNSNNINHRAKIQGKLVVLRWTLHNRIIGNELYVNGGKESKLPSE